MRVNCCYCEKRLDKTNVTKEHIVPVFCGGNNLMFNLIACCRSCNSKRGSDPLFVFRFKIQRYLNRGKIPKDMTVAGCKNIIKNTYIIEKYVSDNLELLIN